jgi:hypothetical protein
VLEASRSRVSITANDRRVVWPRTLLRLVCDTAALREQRLNAPVALSNCCACLGTGVEKRVSRPLQSSDFRGPGLDLSEHSLAGTKQLKKRR